MAGIRYGGTVATGPAATGSPDAYAIDQDGGLVPGAWAQGIDPARARDILAAETSSPWVWDGAQLVPPTVAVSRGVISSVDAFLLSASPGGGAAGSSSLLLLAGLFLLLAVK